MPPVDPLFTMDVELTRAETVRARRMIARSFPIRPRLVASSLFFIFLLGVVIFIEQFGTIGPNGRGPVYLILGGSIGFISFGIYLNRKGIRITRQRTGKRTIYQIDAQGVSVARGGMFTWIAWPLFSRFLSGSESFVLETLDRKRYVLPRRCFASAADQTVFAELAGSRIDPIGNDPGVQPIDLTKLPRPANVKL